MLPKPMTSGLEARGRFGKQDFVYLSKWLAKADYHYTNEKRATALLDQRMP